MDHLSRWLFHEWVVGPALPSRHASSDIQSDERLPEARVSGQQSQFAKRDATGPEPVQLFAGDVVEHLQNGVWFRRIAGRDHSFCLLQHASLPS